MGVGKIEGKRAGGGRGRQISQTEKEKYQNLKRNNTNKLIYKTEIDSDLENGILMVTRREG